MEKRRIEFSVVSGARNLICDCGANKTLSSLCDPREFLTLFLQLERVIHVEVYKNRIIIRSALGCRSTAEEGGFL